MELRDHLLAQDLIYVGGGSLLNLLAVWEAHELSAILSLAWRQGIVLAGQSAGAMCWFEAGITKSSGKPAARGGARPADRQPLRPLQQRTGPPRRLPRRGRRRHARRLRPRRLRRPDLGGHRPPQRRHRPARRPRLQGQQGRDRRRRVPAPRPLPTRPSSRSSARGHRRVPADHGDAQDEQAGSAGRVSPPTRRQRAARSGRPLSSPGASRAM